MITVERLIDAGISPAAAKLHAPHLQAAADRFQICTPARQAAFVGQAGHETAGFTAFEENLRYRDPERIHKIFSRSVTSVSLAQRFVLKPQELANFVYANKYGNGDVASGDGWRYRGRGAGHLTFKANYADAAEALGRPYVEHPELVAEPEDAALTFAWYWHTRKCNLLADAWHIDSITAQINPARAGAADRQQRCEAARRAFA